jgi:hypothetical protein
MTPHAPPVDRSGGADARYADDAPPRSDPMWTPELVGQDIEVPLVSGEWRRYVNFDYAASAPCLAAVKEAVDEFLPWYSSVHRGTFSTAR